MTRKTNTIDVAIVGAGPAGLMAAVAAAEGGAKVLIIEKLDRPGARLLATGGGRCNVTNLSTTDEFMAAFGKRGRFTADALRALDSEALQALLSRLGVRTRASDGFHVFPASNRAADVRDALLKHARKLGATVLMTSTVTKIVIGNDRVLGIETPHGHIEAHAVVVATGGKSRAKLGGGDSGYDLARSVGHNVVGPVPALVPLVTREEWPHELAGLSLAEARVWIDKPKLRKLRTTGELLFTHRGVSGPAVLDISGEVATLLGKHGGENSEVPLCVEFVAGMGSAEWSEQFAHWRTSDGGRAVRALLSRKLPRALSDVILRTVSSEDLGERGASSLKREESRRLSETLAKCPLTIIDTEGFERAMLARGGVDLREVDPRTLGSRNVGGLFFAGEVLNLQGPCGGYNLQWAFSSGRLAGASAAAFSADDDE